MPRGRTYITMGKNLTNVHDTKRTKSKQKKYRWKSYEKNISPHIKKNVSSPIFARYYSLRGFFCACIRTTEVEGSKIPPSANLPPISISFLFPCTQQNSAATAIKDGCRGEGTKLQGKNTLQRIIIDIGKRKCWKFYRDNLHTYTPTSRSFLCPHTEFVRPEGNHQTARNGATTMEIK